MVVCVGQGQPRKPSSVRPPGRRDKTCCRGPPPTLVSLPDVAASPNDFWMPRGKPVKAGKGWDKKPAKEARLELNTGFVSPELRGELRDWWLKVVPKNPALTKMPTWDVASTCGIEGMEGLILVEAKAHLDELSKQGKKKPRTANGWKNHERIGSAIKQANAGLERATGGSWGLSRDHHYQLANRFAWSWKLALVGVPVVLVYLGFLNVQEMAPKDVPLRSEGDWTRALKDHTRGIVDDRCWGKRMEVNGIPFWPLMRTIDVPFTPTAAGGRASPRGGGARRPRSLA